MSLIWTESFAGFERHNGGNDANATSRLIEAMGAAGYMAYQQAAWAHLAVTPDPVTPSRSGLRFNSTSLATGMTAGLAYELPVSPHPVIFGFSLYIPPGYVEGPAGAVAFLVGLHQKGAADWSTYVGSAERMAFSIRSDLSIGVHTNTPQSVMKPAIGRVSFFEVRLDGPNVSVWMDDALVHQSTVIEQAGMISLMFLSPAVRLNDAVLGNLYILSQDDIAPNVRLGPSTRVIGRRPSSDVRADFLRPAAYPSNAATAAQDISATPTDTLQSTTVGDTDIYAAEVDAETAAAGIVHAVAVKTVAANLEAAPHTLKPLIISDSAENNEGGALSLQQIPPFTTQTFNFIVEHPTKGMIAGGNGESLYYSEDDGESWVKISETGGVVNYNHAVFSSNGNGVILRSDGGVMYCHDSSPITDWQYAASGVAFNFKRVSANGDTFIMVSDVASNQTRKLTYPANGSLTFAASGLTAVAKADVIYANDVWMVPSNGISAQIQRSEDNGQTWHDVNSGVSASNFRVRRMAYGNGIWLMSSTSDTGVYLIQRSVDNGLTWANVTTSLSGGFYRHIVELKFVDGLFIAVGYCRMNVVNADGIMLATSPDGINWNYYPRVKVGAAAAATANDFVVTKTGRMIIVAGNGEVFINRQVGAVKDLPVMGGYRLQYALATKDPATGLPWTPEAAAASQFGMRVES